MKFKYIPYGYIHIGNRNINFDKYGFVEINDPKLIEELKKHKDVKLIEDVTVPETIIVYENGNHIVTVHDASTFPKAIEEYKKAMKKGITTFDPKTLTATINYKSKADNVEADTSTDTTTVSSTDMTTKSTKKTRKKRTTKRRRKSHGNDSKRSNS